MEVPGYLMVLTQTLLARLLNVSDDKYYNAGAGTQSGIGRCGPKITTQPSDQSICENGNASFSVYCQWSSCY